MPKCPRRRRRGGRSQTYLVPGENPLDRHTRTFAAIEIACLDLIGKAVGKPVCDLLGGRVRDAVNFSAYLFYKHGGGGGVGADAREDEYGEVLDARACVRECRQMIAAVRLPRDQAQGRRARPGYRNRHHPGAAPGVRRELSAAHRSQLRLERRHLRARRPRIARGALRRRLPGRPLRHARRHGRSAPPPAGRRQRHAAGQQRGRHLLRRCASRQSDWTPCRSCFPTRITGAACATCNTSRTSPACSAWASPCTPTATWASA